MQETVNKSDRMEVEISSYNTKVEANWKASGNLSNEFPEPVIKLAAVYDFNMQQVKVNLLEPAEGTVNVFSNEIICKNIINYDISSRLITLNFEERHAYDRNVPIELKYELTDHRGVTTFRSKYHLKVRLSC